MCQAAEDAPGEHLPGAIGAARGKGRSREAGRTGGERPGGEGQASQVRPKGAERDQRGPRTLFLYVVVIRACFGKMPLAPCEDGL